jgi:hypothetical protein
MDGALPKKPQILQPFWAKTRLFRQVRPSPIEPPMTPVNHTGGLAACALSNLLNFYIGLQCIGTGCVSPAVL